MGWFWADTTPLPAAPQPLPKPSSLSPPPSCPMHRPSSDSSPHPFASSNSSAQPPRECPVKHSSSPSSTSATSTSTPSYVSKLNPLNYMPHSISNKRDFDSQSVSLPLDREASTIPRGQGQGTWEYPSPQQMYNAMLRKGYTDTPAEHVESMVAVHNFLNEGAWDEIREWERRFSRGLKKGAEYSLLGEAGAARAAALDQLRDEMRDQKKADEKEPYLVRFMGRPGDLTPKARWLSFMAWLNPAEYPDNKPFDRHDWFVARQTPSGETKEVRYVIDYYSGPPEENGEPVFYLDVRPAVDGPTSACERMLRWGGDVWHRASGASVREELVKQKQRQRA